MAMGTATRFSTRKKTKTLLFVALGLLCSSCNSSCTKSKVAVASKKLASNITATNTPTSAPNVAIPIEERRIYIDASLSMRGFANSQNHSAFDELIDELGDALPGCRLYKYGQAGTQSPEKVSELTSPTNFGQELHTQGFYNLTYNPDDRLVDDLASRDDKALSVLVTDGVYSEPEGSTSPAVVGAIERWMDKGHALGILVFTSAFNGPLYSERRRAMLPTVSVEARPFYAFVFSPNTQGVNDLRDRLLRRFPDLKTIVFSNDAITTSLTLPPKTTALYTSASPRATPYYWQMWDHSLFGKKASVDLNYQVNYSLSAEYPVAELTITMVPQYHRWTKEQFKKVESGVPDGFSNKIGETKASGSNASVNFTVTLPKDLNTDFGLYDLRFHSSIKSLRPDIVELSTRDDSARESANKTYRFYELVYALADVHFKKNLAARTTQPLFVTVANH